MEPICALMLPLALLHSFTKQIVPSIVSRIIDLKVVNTVFTSFSCVPMCAHMCLIKCIKNVSTHTSFFPLFLLSLFRFHHTLFRGLAEACVNPRSFLLIHSFSNNSMDFSKKLVSASIRIPREYSDTQLYRFSALILTFYVIKHIFQGISVIK